MDSGQSKRTTVPIEVVPYSIARLAELFIQESEAGENPVEEKTHLKYFEEYFLELKAKTIVVERRYTDRDWIEDYAAFYARCLEKYGSRCCRLHFFRLAFNEEDLSQAVTGTSNKLDEKTLRDCYLGFIVIKPLPRTYIGRTCLNTYPSLGGERVFPVTRDYEVHLLGLDLRVKASLAFQEQDAIAAACATSALWSAFHGTGILFHHPILSPIEITRTATATRPSPRREIPNRGLSLPQIAEAVRKVGLEPEYLGVNSLPLLQATTYAYLRAGIPILLMVQLLDISDQANPKFYHDDPENAHAVTITGYRTGYAECKPYAPFGTLLTSSRINKLYVHDDQVGPFARVTVRPEPLKIEVADGCYEEIQLTMDCSWLDDDGARGNIAFAPYGLVIPLYHKIRLPFDVILSDILLRYDALIEERRHTFSDLLAERLEWQVLLTTVGQLKRELREKLPYSRRRLYDLLQQPWPRFVWRAIALHKGKCAFELLFDATDIEQGNYVLGDPLLYDESFAAVLP